MNTYTEKERQTLSLLERTVELILGCKAEDLRNSTLDEQRSAVEQKQGHRMVFRCAFPVIGRGNIMRDRTQSRDEIDRLIDEALK
jgi:hypothetical protein